MRTLITSAALLALSAAPAIAQCAQDQLVGDWSLVGSNNGAWTHCTFSIGADGTFEGRCRGTNRPRRGIPAEGLLEVDTACALTGEIAAGGPAQAIEGVLDEGGTVGVGIARFGPRRQNLGIHFNLVKRP